MQTHVVPPKNPFLLYLRSRLSAGLAFAAGLLVVLAIVLLRGRSLVPVVGVAGAYAVVTIILFFSRRGAQEIVRESEEDQLARNRQKISTMEQLRERISVLRLGDERISKAVEYFLQESGSYLQKCRELASYSPGANERIERVLEICQVFLGERDEESTGRRYGVPEGGAGLPAEQAAEDFARDILDCARVIKDRTVEDLLGGGDAERLEITNELEENK
ncbi:MAG TPA: hypothetical protein VL354_18190 [Spirochaetia bacterium]|nr:hypothetical protein [Spirochaetia bacterium]